MIVVADTCSLLMLLRLNPEMLTDSKFGCCTTQEVRDEIIRTSKFADKYPWRVDYREKIRVIPKGTVIHASSYRNAAFSVKAQLDQADPDEGPYNLSEEDCSVIILAQILPELHFLSIDDPGDIAISTTDRLLINFAEKRFEIENIEPLELLNTWIENGFWIYNSQDHDAILQEWAEKEPRQSFAARKHFKKLTGHTFPD